MFIIRWSSATFIFHLYFLQWNILDELERLKLFSFWAIRAHRNVHNKMVIHDFHFSPLFFTMKYFGWIGEIKIIFYGLFAAISPLPNGGGRKAAYRSPPIEMFIIRWSSATFIFHLCFLQGNILDEMERLKLFSFWAISRHKSSPQRGEDGRRRRAHRNTHNKMVIRDFHFSHLFFSMKYFGWIGEIKKYNCIHQVFLGFI